MISVPVGDTDITTYFKLLDPATGGPKTGATITDIDLTYIRDRALAVKNDATALGSADAAHADNQAIEVDATNAPGLYRIDWPDNPFAGDVDKVTLYVLDGSGNDNFVCDPLDVVLEASIGTPVALDGGTATIAGMLTKLADDNGGASFVAETDSQRAITASIVAGFPTHSPATAGNITTGTDTAGDFTTTATNDGNYWQVAAAAAVGGFGLNMDLTFALGTELKAATVTVNAKETLVGVVLVWAWNYTTLAWDQIADAITGISGSSDQWYTYILLASHQQTSDGEIKLRFTSTDTNAAKFLYLDQVVIDAVAISAVTPAEIAQAVHEADLDLVRHDGGKFLAGHIAKRVLALGTTVSVEDSTTSFTLAAGIAVADAYNDMLIEVRDISSGTRDIEIRRIVDWTAGRVVTVDRAFSFLPTADDEAHIHNKYVGTNVKAMATDVQQELAANIHSTNVWYVTKAGNDANSGTSWADAFLTVGAAVAAASSGDAIIVGAGTFTETVDGSGLDGIKMVGDGVGVSIITTSGVASKTLQVGDNWELRDISIKNTEVAAGNSEWCIYASLIANVDIADVEMVGNDGGFYFSATADGIVRLKRVGIWAAEYCMQLDSVQKSVVDLMDVNCIANGWTVCDCVCGLFQLGTDSILTATRTSFVATLDAGNVNSVWGISLRAGEIIFSDCNIRAENPNNNAGSFAFGLSVSGLASRALLFGGNITTEANTGTARDIHNGGSTPLAVAETYYDITKTYGTITHVPPGAEILADVTGINGEAMRGTDSAALASAYTAARATKLDDLDVAVSTRSSHTAAQAGTDAAAKVLETPANKLKTDASGEVTAENMRGTDGANTVAPDNAGIANAKAAAESADGKLPADTTTKLARLDAAVSSRSSHTAAQAGTDAAAKVLETPANLLKTDASGEVTAENMRGTDGASTVDPDNTGIADIKAKTDNLPADPASETNQTTILNRLGAFAGTGINTVLGLFKALLRKDATAPTDVGGTFDPATDSIEALAEAEAADGFTEADRVKLTAVKGKTDRITPATVNVSSPVAEDGTIEIISGDSYLTDQNTQIDVTIEDYAGPPISGAAVAFVVQELEDYTEGGTAGETVGVASAVMSDADCVLSVELTAAETAALETAPPEAQYNHMYRFMLTIAGKVHTPAQGKLNVKKGAS